MSDDAFRARVNAGVLAATLAAHALVLWCTARADRRQWERPSEKHGWPKETT